MLLNNELYKYKQQLELCKHFTTYKMNHITTIPNDILILCFTWKLINAR